MLDRIFEAYDAVLVLDTETTGISCRKDEIIELAVLKAGQDVNGLCELETMDGSPRGGICRKKLSSLQGSLSRCCWTTEFPSGRPQKCSPGCSASGR